MLNFGGEIKMEPKNRCLEDDFPFQYGKWWHFLGSILIFLGVWLVNLPFLRETNGYQARNKALFLGEVMLGGGTLPKGSLNATPTVDGNQKSGDHPLK